MSTNKDISGHMMCLSHVHFVSDTRDPALSSKGYVVEMWACPLIRTYLDNLLFCTAQDIRVSTALLIVLQSLHALYQLLLHKKVYFYCYGLPHILLKI